MSILNNDRETFAALIPFSGDLSPVYVRERMVGPILHGPSAAIWRKTSFSHTGADGSFTLFACESTRQAMWVPSGDFFVTDRPQGHQPSGTIMDYLFNQERQGNRAEGYGIHGPGQVFASEGGNIRRPGRPVPGPVVGLGRGMATRPPPRFNPMARPESSGTRRTVSRRERRER